MRNRSAPNLEPEFAMMVLPSSDQFKDIHEGMLTDLPPITETKITEFLACCDKGVIEEKCKDLYRQRYSKFLILPGFYRYCSKTIIVNLIII